MTRLRRFRHRRESCAAAESSSELTPPPTNNIRKPYALVARSSKADFRPERLGPSVLLTHRRHLPLPTNATTNMSNRKLQPTPARVARAKRFRFEVVPADGLCKLQDMKTSFPLTPTGNGVLADFSALFFVSQDTGAKYFCKEGGKKIYERQGYHPKRKHFLRESSASTNAVVEQDVRLQRLHGCEK